ncbi:hypothetical protein EDB19DRAFT_1834636 [Suillus lakei]|nr:hypothetical protein EDB19DRAFT_1834636 [Suillus lakei]
MHFKAGLQWEITLQGTSFWSFQTRSLIFFSCFPSSPGTLFQITSFHPTYWIGHTAIPNELWQWDWVFACCVCHYQHWLSGIEDDGLVLPEQVDETSVPTLLALKWMRECLRTLVEEQQEGIHEKMAEIEVYTAILTRLKRGRGE